MSFNPERLFEALDDCVRGLAPAPSGLCVALSGGLDSTVLIAALARLRNLARVPPLRAIHVDHGLHADAPQWARACAALCDRLGVPCGQVTVDARPAPGESPEAAARTARYMALTRMLGDTEVLVTAHHADDQLEGILLQWLRGGGLRAVAGMPRVAPFGSGWHARPMLNFTREDLRTWGEQEGLAWLEDPSNLDPRFDRNYLRMEVLPVIRGRWPAAARTVARVAGHAAEALQIESALASADLESVARGSALSLDALARLPVARQRLVLRAWLRQLGLPVPSERTLAALRHDMLEAADDRLPRVNWPGVSVHRYRRYLHALGQAEEAATIAEGNWPVGSAFDLGSLGRLTLRPATGKGLRRDGLPPVLRVDSRTGGEVFRPAGSEHRRPLRKWLQERGILPWRREQLPLIRVGDEVAAIGDIAYGESFAAGPGEPSWQIAWEGRPVLTESEAMMPSEVAGRGPFR